MSIFKFSPKFAALTAASALLLTACVAGESEVKAGAATSAESLTIDFATYNPLSLVIKEKGWLEDELDGVEVTWVQSAGSKRPMRGCAQRPSISVPPPARPRC